MRPDFWRETKASILKNDQLELAYNTRQQLKMWLMKDEGGGQAREFFIVPGQEYVIGRKGGEIAAELNASCTHLIMEKITFTIKVVCAIASACPIVTPDFFENLVKVVEDPYKQPDNTAIYIPEVAEPSLINKDLLFQPNVKRKTIFNGKNFLFLSKKQFARLSPAIIMAGGRAELKEEIDPETLRSFPPDSMVIMTPERKDELAANVKQREFFTSIKNEMHRLNLRTVNESEVGLAILHLSLENYCNPRHSTDNSNTSRMHSQAIHDTNFEHTCQRNIKANTSTETNHEISKNDAHSKKQNDILASDSQAEQEKKRKRLSDTSMYVTDTVPLDGTLPFHLAKRSKRGSSDDQKEPEVPTDVGRNTSVVGEQEKHKKESRHGGAKKDSSAFHGGKTRQEEEIEDIANSIFENDDGFEEALFAVDTENRTMDVRDKKSTDKSPGIRNTDKSRVAESQFWGNLDNESNRKQLAENAGFHDVCDTNMDQTDQDTQHSKSNLKDASGWMSVHEKSAKVKVGLKDEEAAKSEVSRVLESQFTEGNRNSQQEPTLESKDIIKIGMEVECSSRKTNGLDGFSANVRYDDDDADTGANAGANVAETPSLSGFKSAKMDQRTNDIKPEIDPDQPNASTIVRFSTLVVKRVQKQQQLSSADLNVKNFKKFKKAFFPGKDRVIPNIIGGSDLAPFKSEDQSKNDLFEELRAAYAREEREQREDDDLFKVDLKPKQKTKKLTARS
eukprot:gene1404-15818_t